MIKELTKQLEELQIKNDNLTKINVELTKQLEELTKNNVDLTKKLANFTKIDNKPTINWTKNKLITFCKENNISGYSNSNKTKLLELIHSKQNIVKGQLSSINGNIYEKKIHNIIKNTLLNNKQFNTQNQNDLGNSTNKCDILCNFLKEQDIGIEIKSYNTPDWMQFSINYLNNKWQTKTNNKIIDDLIQNINLYNGKIPSFISKHITYNEWSKEKHNFKDVYLDIPNDTIRKLYYEKGCKYIQINYGYGLYHLENDICAFNVPIFEIKQELRIRIKVHSTKLQNGYCSLSITASCKPKNIKDLPISNYSLDNIDKLPNNLIYKINNVSPLRYPGGKTKACNKLYDILTTYFDLSKFKTIISPFFGGGSFEFHLQNTFPNLHIIANDKFTPLYNFWNTCNDNKDRLCKELYPYINTITKNKFQDLRNKILTETDPLKQSIMFFIINRCSFSGATLSGGFSLESSTKRFTTTSIERISKLNLDRLTITNMDFEEFLKNNNSIIFLDPPYYLESKSNLYGNNGDLHEHFDHIKLHKCLSNKNNWIMTYNNCNYIRDLYKNYKIIETDWNYGMNKSKKSNEIVIICYN